MKNELSEQKKQKKTVKLYTYLEEPERTFVESYEAEDFDNFKFVRIDPAQWNTDDLNSFIEQLYESLGRDKKILVIDKNIDIAIYGVKEDEDDD